MQINNFYNAYRPKQSPNQKRPAFKGYFACPIKELHIQSARRKRYSIVEELQKKCGHYFRILVQSVEDLTEASQFTPQNQKTIPNIYYGTLNSEYGQDNKLFTENGILLLKSCDNFGWEDATKLAQHLNLPTRDVEPYIEGGNCFLGKKPDVDTFALVGQDALTKKRYGGSDVYTVGKIRKEKLAEALKLHPDNVHIIPQADHHLDMAIRPLKYPYVLVDNRDLTHELVRRPFQDVRSKHREYLLKRNFASPEEVAHALEQQGFKPIFVPGSLGYDRKKLNYLNAIVHQKPDGKLVYITNRSSKSRGYLIGSDMEQVFSQHLKEQCPDVDEVIFIDGEGAMERCLNNESAGLHCLFSERPDFGKWATMLTSAH